MSSRVSFLVRTIIVAGAAFALLIAGLSQANAVEEKVDAAVSASQAGSGDGEPVIQATERISIPYGFNPSLPRINNGATVEVSGLGACEVNQSITIAYTVTQSTSGASVTGVWNGQCTGQLQTWTDTPAATQGPNFDPGVAEACAFAETFDGDTVTDDFQWCDMVILDAEQIYLPFVKAP